MCMSLLPMRATCHAHCIILNFNKIFSVQQPRQVVQWRVSDVTSIISVLVTRTEMVLETSAYSPLNHLTRLLPQKCFIELSRRERLLKLHTHTHTHTHTHARTRARARTHSLSLSLSLYFISWTFREYK